MAHSNEATQRGSVPGWDRLQEDQEREDERRERGKDTDSYLRTFTEQRERWEICVVWLKRQKLQMYVGRLTHHAYNDKDK